MSANRPPFNPGQGGAPSAVTAQDECALLPNLRAALYAAATGTQLAQVRDGDRWASYAHPDMKLLKQQIRRLEIMCEGPRYAHGAVEVGPPRHRGGPGYGFPFGRRWPY